jgi:hypothetical protein
MEKTSMRHSRYFQWVLAALLLASCSTVPKRPSVMVLPGTGKDFKLFTGDDTACRQYASERVSAPGDQPDSWEEGQEYYDTAYIQCMYDRGHRVPVPGDVMFKAPQDARTPPPPDLPKPPSATGAPSR